MVIHGIWPVLTETKLPLNCEQRLENRLRDKLWRQGSLFFILIVIEWKQKKLEEKFPAAIRSFF